MPPDTSGLVARYAEATATLRDGDLPMVDATLEEVLRELEPACEWGGIRDLVCDTYPSGHDVS